MSVTLILHRFLSTASQQLYEKGTIIVPHFTLGEIEALRGDMTYPKSHSLGWRGSSHLPHSPYPLEPAWTLGQRGSVTQGQWDCHLHVLRRN